MDGALFVRGVGSAPADESLRLSSEGLHRYLSADILKAEVNWSWTAPVRWPFGNDKTRRGDIIPFLRAVGAPLRRAATAPGASKTTTLVVQLLGWAPVLLLLAMLVTVGGKPDFGARLVLSWATVLWLPCLFALATVRSWLPIFLRAAALLTLWPIVGMTFSGAFTLIISVGLVAYLGSAFGAFALVARIPGATVSALSEGGHAVPTATALGTFIEVLIALPVVWLTFVVARSLALSFESRLRRVFGPVLKVAADVTRYVGDRSYRSLLREKFRQEVAALDQAGSTRTLVFAHSLGTVIAVDTLASCTFQNIREVQLVTGGSPLLRLHGFFPCQYSTPSYIGDRLAAALATQGVVFGWTNVFRPRDPVGTTLHLPAGCESSTAQPHSWLTAHLDYWSDPTVHEYVSRHLGTPWPASESAARDTEPARPFSDAVAPEGNSLLPTLVVALSLSFAVALPINVLASTWRTYMEGIRALRDGVVVEASAERTWTTIRVYTNADDELGRPVDVPHFTVHFVVGEKTYELAPPPWLVNLAPLGQIPATRGADGIERFPVHVIYAPAHPQMFTLRGYERRPLTLRTSLLAGAALLLATLCLLTALVYGWARGVGDLVAGMVGVDPNSRWGRLEALSLNWSGLIVLPVCSVLALFAVLLYTSLRDSAL